MREKRASALDKDALTTARPMFSLVRVPSGFGVWELPGTTGVPLRFIASGLC